MSMYEDYEHKRLYAAEDDTVIKFISSITDKALEIKTMCAGKALEEWGFRKEDVEKSLLELSEYRKLGTVEEVRKAVEKDTDKKVIIKPFEPCKCPTCDKELSESVGDGYYKHYYYLKRCPECGQRLDWGD